MVDDAEDPRITELEADNRRLRRLLDQRDAPGELRHRLRGTLALLRTIIRRSAEATSDLDAYVAHLEDRVDALARAQIAVDTHGAIDLHRLLADELFAYKASESERLDLEGPTVRLEPRAGQALALAVHELAVNAIEHGVLGSGSGRISVAWQAAGGQNGTGFTFTWKETGMTGLSQPTRQGFGTEVLMRTLPYELGAETRLAFEPDGLACTIRFPLTARLGRVVDDQAGETE